MPRPNQQIPIEHHEVEHTNLGGFDAPIYAHRNGQGPTDQADTIFVGARIDGDGAAYGNVILYLTPAMVIKLANAVLTDAERTHLTAPSLPAAWNAMSETEREEILSVDGAE